MPTHPDISLPLTPGRAYHIYNRGNEKRYIFFERGHYFRFLRKVKEYMGGFVDVYAYALMSNHFHLCIRLRSAEEIFARAREVKFDKVDSLFKRRYVTAWLLSSDAAAARLTVSPIWKEALLTKHYPRIMEYSLSDLVKLLNELPELPNEAPPPQHPTSANSPTIDLPQQTTSPQSDQPHPLALEDLSPTDQLSSYIVSEQLRRCLLSHSKYINTVRDRTGSLFQKAFRRKHIADEEYLKMAITYIHHNPIHHHYCKDFESYEWTSFHAYLSDKPTSLAKDKAFDLFGGKRPMIDFHQTYRDYRWNDQTYYIEDQDE